MSGCITCEGDLQEEYGAPVFEYKAKKFCFQCYIDMVEPLYRMAGMGDGGIIHIIFDAMLKEPHNRRVRKTMANYRKVFEQIAHRYKFACVTCGAKDNLTLDHIHPVSRGGTDDASNLQLMCKSCNSKKGARI